ncbi:MAG: hypothetical protein ACHQF0_16410 [Chitinophagales bacterium]
MELAEKDQQWHCKWNAQNEKNAVYVFTFKGSEFSIGPVENDDVFSEWIQLEVMTVLQD